MKKFTLLLSAMLLACATGLWAASLGEGYTKVTDISSLAVGDKVVLYADDASVGVTGWNSNKDATVAETGWVEYVVEAAEKGVLLKDEAESKYIASPGNANVFQYGETGGVCSVDQNGVLCCNSRYLCKNSTYHRMYSSIGTYNPFYVYKLVSADTSADTLTALTITGTPDKIKYEVGETFIPAGLVVIGTYSEGEPQSITSGIKWTITPEVLTSTTITEVKVIATVDTVSSAEYSVPITVTEHVVTPGTYSIDLNAGLYGLTTTGQNATEQTVTKNDITIISGCTSSATSKTYYDAGHIRYYANSYLKLAVPTGYDITKVEFTADGTWNGDITPSVGTYNNDNKAWTGNAPDSLIFSFAKQNRVKTIVVTYEVHQEVLVAAPVLTAEAGKVAEGEFVQAFRLTMSCETEDATILYTLDGSDPTTSETVATYTAPITIIETTTVRAIAQKAELWSRETTETFTKIAALTTMDEIFATATEATSSNTITKYITFSDWIISGVINSNAYLTDGTKGLIIYTSTHGFEVGDVLNGTVACDITLFNGNAEIKGLKATNTGLTITKGGTAPVQTPSIAELSPINTGSLISLSNLTYNGGVLADAADNTITPYGTFITLPTMTNGKQYNVKGVYIDYKGTKEIAPLAESDIQEVTTPSAIDNAVIETPAVKTIENGQLVIMRDGVKYNAMGVRL